MDMKCTRRVTGITDVRDAGSMTGDRVDSGVYLNESHCLPSYIATLMQEQSCYLE